MKFRYIIIFINTFTCSIASAEAKSNLNNSSFEKIRNELVEIKEIQKKNQDFDSSKYYNENKTHEEIISSLNEINKNLNAISIKLSEISIKLNDSNNTKEKVAIKKIENTDNNDLELKSN